MGRHDILHLTEPEFGELVQNLPFIGNSLPHDVIKGGDTVGNDNPEPVATQLIDVPYFSPVGFWQVRVFTSGDTGVQGLLFLLLSCGGAHTRFCLYLEVFTVRGPGSYQDLIEFLGWVCTC